MNFFVLLVVFLGLLTACGRSEAPRDWAANRGLDSGSPPPDRAVSTPTNEARHAGATRAGQDRFWIGLTTALVGLTGIGVALGVWVLEARKRLRAAGDALVTAIEDRLRGEGFEDVDVTPAPARLFGGEVVLMLSGPVMSETDRKRVVAIGTEEARRGPMQALVVDRLTLPAFRRAAG